MSWSMHPSIQSSLPEDPDFGKREFPPEILKEIFLCLDQLGYMNQGRSEVASNKRKVSEQSAAEGMTLGTLKDLSVMNKRFRSAVLDILYNHLGRRLSLALTSEVKAITTGYLDLTSCPMALYHPDILQRLQPFKKITTWKLSYIPSDHNHCSLCSSLTPIQGRITPILGNMPSLISVTLNNVDLDSTKWRSSPTTFPSVEVVRINRDYGEIQDLSSLMAGIAFIFPGVRDLIYHVYQDETIDDFAIFDTLPSPEMKFDQLQYIWITTQILLSPETRILRSGKGNLAISGPRNHLRRCRNPIYFLNHINNQVSQYALHPSFIPNVTPMENLFKDLTYGQDPDRDRVHTFYSSLKRQRGCPRLKELHHKTQFTWRSDPEKEIHGLYSFICADWTFHLPAQLHLPPYEHPITYRSNPYLMHGNRLGPLHPDGSLGCDMSLPTGICPLAEKLTNNQSKGDFKCQACYWRASPL